MINFTLLLNVRYLYSFMALRKLAPETIDGKSLSLT